MESLCAFGERIKELIFDKKITPEILSDRLNLDLSLIYKWQRGDSVPNLDSLIRLSRHFCVTIDFLSGRNDENHFTNTECRTPFNIRLQEIINETGLSNYAFSRKYNISRETIRHWVNGERTPLLDSIIKLADLLDVTIDNLVGMQ